MLGTLLGEPEGIELGLRDSSPTPPGVGTGVGESGGGISPVGTSVASLLGSPEGTDDGDSLGS